jgi:hypothetical protein
VIAWDLDMAGGAVLVLGIAVSLSPVDLPVPPIGFGLQTSRFSMGNNKKPYQKNGKRQVKTSLNNRGKP